MVDPKMITYTLRLSEDLRNRLDRSAAQRNKSLNQLIIDLIERYYRGAGFIDTKTITSAGRREYEIRTEISNPHPPDQPTCFFYLDDPASGKQVRYYTIGLTRQAINRLAIREEDIYKVITEIGIALLHHYNRLGRDVCKIIWNQFPSYPERRVISMKNEDLGGTFINSEEKFLQALQDDTWFDPYLVEAVTLAEAIWTTKGTYLGFWSGENVFSSAGLHIGQICTTDTGHRKVYSLNGRRYIGTIFKNRLVTDELHVHSESVEPVARQRPRVAIDCDSQPPIENLPQNFSGKEIFLENLDELLIDG